VKTRFVTILLLFICGFAVAQDDTLQEPNYRFRKTALITTAATGYAASMTGLYYAWYSNYPQSSFHFINDNNEWLQMDKIGHGASAYQIGRIGYEAMRWAGYSEKPSALIGGSAGFVYLTVIEILDGFSAEWGASGGDLIANTTGSMLFIGQQLLWKEQKIMLKYSYHPTPFAAYRPGLLGKNHAEQWLKDYNGQTYWLSFNINSLLRNKDIFPDWFCLSIGYSATGMTGAVENPLSDNGQPIPWFERNRQFYFSADVDLSKIKTRYRGVNMFLNVVNFIKIPFPALEYNNKKGLILHPLYF